jgi:hypothetical protein
MRRNSHKYDNLYFTFIPMMYTTYPAHIRQHRIVLETETELPETAEAVLIVLKKQEIGGETIADRDFLAERNDWYALAAQSLNRAYSDDEPDYSNVPLLEVNPFYQPPMMSEKR